jgi:hypothetical protein
MVPASQLLAQRVCQRGSVYPKTKPALVYTSIIHSTVTTRSSCGDLLRLDSTCGRSGSLVVRREWARSPLERFSQNIGAGSVGPSTGSPLRSSNKPRVLVELVLPKEVVELSRCNSFVLMDSSVRAGVGIL